MKEQSTKILLLINALIFLILLFALVRKEPVYVNSDRSSAVVSSGSSFGSVQLGDNRIAIIYSDTNSSRYGEIVVLEYDTELNTFNEISDYDIFLEE